MGASGSKGFGSPQNEQRRQTKRTSQIVTLNRIRSPGGETTRTESYFGPTDERVAKSAKAKSATQQHARVAKTTDINPNKQTSETAKRYESKQQRPKAYPQRDTGARANTSKPQGACRETTSQPIGHKGGLKNFFTLRRVFGVFDDASRA